MNFKDMLSEQGLDIPYSANTDCLSEPLVIGGRTVSNRIGILPLEGYDSTTDGSPTEFVYRRYLRFVEGGAGLIWFEACAVSDDGKSNPYQMMLHDGNVGAFRQLIQAMDKKASKRCFKVLQLTHSGRISKDETWRGIPLSPKKYDDSDHAEYASDDRIEQMVREHIRAACLAADAGFDAVDIKVCHGYFLSEMLSAYNREGRYGGSYENRTRAIFEIVDGIREKLGDRIVISVRLNAYDSVPYPYGYGVAEENGVKRADLTEAVRLCSELRDHGVKLINISASAPRERMMGPEPKDAKYKKYGTSCDYLLATKYLKEHVDGVTFMCTGLTGFGVQGGYVAAGGVEEKWFDIAGFGRQALAYPSFAGDILYKGQLEEQKCCVDCYKCYSLMDPGHCRTGCIVRDRDEFFPLYQKNVLNNK